MDSSRMEVEDGEHIGDEYEFTEGVHGGEVESRNKNGLDMEVDHDAKQGQGGKEKSRDSGKHRSKDRKKERREEKEHGSRDRERSKNHDSTKNKDYNLEASDTKEKDRVMTRERRDDREEYSKEKERDKERNMEKVREKDYDNAKYRDREHVRDKDREKELVRGKERGRERDKDRERDRDREKESERSRVRIRDHDKQSERDWKKDRGKEKELEREKDRDRDREGEKEWDRGKDKEREKEKGRDREKEKDKDRDKLETDKGKEKIREKDKDREKTKERENDKVDGRNRDRYEKEITKVKDRKRDEKLRTDSYEDQDMDKQETGRDTHGKFSAKDDKKKVEASNRSQSTLQLEERVLKMKEERLKKSEGASEVLAWVSKGRVLEEKRTAEKQKAMQLSKVFEEQDNLDHGENEDEEAGATSQRGAKDLAGVKILHGLDKVAEGGAVVLTLKDQNILANGDINEEVDILENVEIGEQKQRDEAYKAAKKKTGIYDDKFSDDPGSQRAILPQYDDPVQDEGITLDESGRFTGEAEKKLEEVFICFFSFFWSPPDLRKRLQGASTSNRFEDLTSSGKMSSDFYTQEEMLQFKKPKKKKSLRKKNKLDLDALEAEAISAGLGAGDLGSRDEAKRRALKEERERSEAEIRSNAYQSAVAKAEEASKALRMEQTLTFQTEAENPVFGDDDEDLYKPLEKARKLALKKHGEAAIYEPQAVALLAVSNSQSGDKLTTTSEEPEENKVVFTEMEEFVWGLQLDEETHKPEAEDVFMDEEVIPKSIEETKDEAGGWTEVKESGEDESPVKEQKKDIVADNTIHEPAVGKGLSGALQLLKERGTLKEDVDWGGRNMDKKKSKLVGINDNDGPKEIRIDRLDEFGRIMTPKEAFRMISHKFHGKGPGKTKQEKRMKQYHEELKLKQMKASDTPSQSMERMREAQARLQSPYLVLSGHVKPGQTSDPRSGFATVEKDHPGSLTPMLGDRKVEHFLGIKRKAEPSNMGPPKKPKI